MGRKEPFYCETVQYINRLKKAGIEAKLDVYDTGVHAFDILLPFRKISKQASNAFETQFLYARDHYFALQKPEEAL